VKVALVHDWFNDVGGAEKVVKEIIDCFPEADIYCLFDFFDDKKRKLFLHGKTTRKSFIQNIPLARKFYRFLFPLFTRAIESLDLSGYDLIISSSYCVAKGIKKNKEQLHICYCHSPVRYAWNLREDYTKAVQGALKRKVLNYFFDRLKEWDIKSNDRVDYFIANSHNVQERIKENYKRDSVVIYPPVEIEAYALTLKKDNYYMTVSRQVAYKKTELLVKAFSQLPDLQFEVAGDGPNKKKLEKLASSNVKILGFIDEQTKKSKVQNAKAFIAAANEDFGITIVEAQAAGTPVIVPYIGGYKETVTDETGLFYKEQTVEDIVEAIVSFEKQKSKFLPENFAKNVNRFKTSRFHNELLSYVKSTYDAFKHAK